MDPIKGVQCIPIKNITVCFLESTIDNLIKFLSKYTKTVKDKTKKKKGGNRSKTILGGKHHHLRKSRNLSKNKIKYRKTSSKRVK